MRNLTTLPEMDIVYTVSQLNEETRCILEDTYGQIWITGEISNLSRPTSGHLYFSLKDAGAQVRCALFKGSQRQLNFTPENGQQVLVLAQVSLYEPRGDYQLIAQHLQLAGEGALQIAFNQLKQKLGAEGLFAEEYKKPIPLFPTQIGVITSSSGAALHDILKVLCRRFRCIPVVIYPTQVQGATAAGLIAATINLANERNECDVLIVARGGGSIEDLWCFNEEIVARAIFASRIPIVTGIGHEVDFTIADFVADIRAATPSVAAETVTPDINELQQRLRHMENRLTGHLLSVLRHHQQHLHHLQKRLRHPGQRLREQAQRLDQLEQNLLFVMRSRLERARQQLSEKMRTLDAISPLKTLERGYAIVTRADGHIVRQVNQVQTGERIKARVSDGVLECEVLL